MLRRSGGAAAAADGSNGERKRPKHTIHDLMKTSAYWTRQCSMATAGIPGVRLMTSSDWIAEYDVAGENADLFEGFSALYRRFNREGLGRDKTDVPSVGDIADSPVLYNEIRDGVYDGVAVYFVLVQEEDGTRQTKAHRRKTVKAGWPLAFALVYRLWPKPEINPRGKLPLAYVCHLAADANFGGFGKMLVDSLKRMFVEAVVCLEISIDESDVYSASRQLAKMNLMGFYESLGFISICNLEEGSLLRNFFAQAYESKWMEIRVSGYKLINLLDTDPTAGKWMVLPPAETLLALTAAEKLGLYLSHAKKRRR